VPREKVEPDPSSSYHVLPPAHLAVRIPARCRVAVHKSYRLAIIRRLGDGQRCGAICHNQLYNPHTSEQCRMTPIGDAIRNAVGIRY
jgi:hypothetical protein